MLQRFLRIVSFPGMFVLLIPVGRAQSSAIKDLGA